MTELSSLQQKIKTFVDERDWDQYHSPKNLAMALGVEVSELQELFQWLSEQESYELSDEKTEELREEIGDVLIYLLMLSDKFDIDPLQAAESKLQKNAEKYPVDKAKGKNDKYTDL